MNVSIDNKSDSLRVLFKKGLCKPTKSRGGVITPMYGAKKKNVCRIYFYEWSDISRHPLMFEDVDSFKRFLHGCGICLKSHEVGMCESLGAVYTCCLHGSKELCIRGSYGLLCETMNDNVSKELVRSIQGLKPDEVLRLL